MPPGVCWTGVTFAQLCNARAIKINVPPFKIFLSLLLKSSRWFKTLFFLRSGTVYTQLDESISFHNVNILQPYCWGCKTNIESPKLWQTNNITDLLAQFLLLRTTIVITKNSILNQKTTITWPQTSQHETKCFNVIQNNDLCESQTAMN